MVHEYDMDIIPQMNLFILLKFIFVTFRHTSIEGVHKYCMCIYDVSYSAKLC
jgi:hypothetical protein